MIRPSSLMAATRLGLSPALRCSGWRAPMVSGVSSIRRHVSVETMTPKEGNDRLAELRLQRPNSPHLTIYRPQITWVLSGLNRITGVALSGSLYLFSMAYLTSSLHGIPMDSASIASAFGSLPGIVKFGVKSIAAFPFALHCWNGVRHLLWDSGFFLKLKKVEQTGWFTVGLSALTTLILALL